MLIGIAMWRVSPITHLHRRKTMTHAAGGPLTHSLTIEVEGTPVTLAFPEVQRTARAAQITTSAGAVWIPRADLDRVFGRRSVTVAEAGDPERRAALVERVISSLASVLCASRDALIVVTRAGKGPTDKSAKFRFQATDPDRGTITYTLTLPRSQIREIGGTLYAPRWLLIDKIDFGVHLNAVWLGRGAVAAELDAALVAAAALAAERQAENKRQYEAMREVAALLATYPAIDEFSAVFRKAVQPADKLAAFRAAIADPTFIALNDVRQRESAAAAAAAAAKADRTAIAAAKRAAERERDSIIITGGAVTWTEYLGPVKRRRRVERCAEGVTVALRGQFAEIRCGAKVIRKSIASTGFRVVDAAGTVIVENGAVLASERREGRSYT